MEKHIKEVENIYKQMRGWRHDYHNHIQTMKAYRSLGENEKIDGYLNSLEIDLTAVDTVIKSGNVMVDAILNSKLSLAKNRKIAVTAKAVVPKNITISEIDLCVIIGNLLDNAIEACLRIDDESKRFIRVYMDLKRRDLYLSVTNSSCGRTKKQDGRYLSSKGENHGFGLIRVDKIVDKYAGYIKRNDEDGVFTSEVMLPL
jgi:sensor histidine kinase regulating citrate/malate metabolism